MHGAFGSIAFGIGTSEVEMVMATQCLLQSKPKLMRISIEGQLNPGVVSKDIVLYILSRKITASGATGYAVEFAGSAIRSPVDGSPDDDLQHEYRDGSPLRHDCKPDATTIDYIRGREFAPTGAAWEEK